MTRKEIEDIGITSVKVEFNLSELIVIANLNKTLNDAYSKLVDMPSYDRRRVDVDTLIPKLSKIINLLDKIVPEGIISLDEVEKQLFTIPDKSIEEPVNKYL